MFLYALVTDASINFPHMFLRSLNEVHRNASTVHALFFLVFIHRILLRLGLEDFPASTSIHIVAHIGATFLRQKAAQLRPSSKRPRVEPSGTAPLPPSATGTTSGEASAFTLMMLLLLLFLHHLLWMILTFDVRWRLS